MSESKAEIIQSIAQALSERRKQRKLTVINISQTLKIRSFYIEALEKGEWHELPGDVYVRGFLMRYAQYLGFDAAKLLAPYLEHIKTISTSGDLTPVFKGSETSKSAWIWVGVAVLIFIGLVKFLQPDARRPSTIVETPAPSVPEDNEKEPILEKEKSKREHKLEVYSPFPLWLRIKTDSRSFEGFIPQESTWVMKASGEFNIRMGHAKQVVMIFDGQQVALAEDQKKVILPGQ